MVGGAIGGLISGGLKGALMGAAFGAVGGAIFGGAGYGLAAAIGKAGAFAVLSGVGAGLSYATGGWKGLVIFGAGLAGAYAGSQIGQSVQVKIAAAKEAGGGGKDASGRPDINKAIKELKITKWGQTEGKEIVKTVESLNREGKIGFSEIGDARAQYDPVSDKITIDLSVDQTSLPGRLAHEGTHAHLVKGGLQYDSSANQFFHERSSFNAGFAVDSQLGVRGAFSPSDQWIRQSYGL